MALEYDGKIYRNLQEQVLKNKEDIEAIKEGGSGGGISEDRVNELIDAAAILRDGATSPTGDISWNDKGLVELGFIELDEQVLKPTTETDIWKDTASNIHVTCPVIADFGLNSGGLPVTNVGTPTNSNDAATKAYVDANVGGGLPTFSGSTATVYTASGNYDGNGPEDHEYYNYDWTGQCTATFAEVGNFAFVQIFKDENEDPVIAVDISKFHNTKYALLWGVTPTYRTVYSNNITDNGIFQVPRTEYEEYTILCFCKVV